MGRLDGAGLMKVERKMEKANSGRQSDVLDPIWLAKRTYQSLGIRR